jgi:tripartite-type tricarboxylate transporter receptor subunit TctC
MPVSRGHVRAGLAALALCLPVAAANAQSDYPNRQIRVLVGFAAGGPVDVTTRITSDALSAELGKALVVDNRVGAGGNIAADVVPSHPRTATRCCNPPMRSRSRRASTASCRST